MEAGSWNFKLSLSKVQQKRYISLGVKSITCLHNPDLHACWYSSKLCYDESNSDRHFKMFKEVFLPIH